MEYEEEFLVTERKDVIKKRLSYIYLGIDALLIIGIIIEAVLIIVKAING